MSKETNEKKKMKEIENVKSKKEKKTNIIKFALAAFLVIVIAYLLITFSKKDSKLKSEPDTTIDYNLINIEKGDGNIVMENETNAEVKDGVKRNISNKLLEEKTYNDMKVKDARIEASGGMSQFIATVENPYDKNIEGEIIELVFINEDRSEIARVETFFPDLEPNGISEVNASTDIDITTAYDFYIERK